MPRSNRISVVVPARDSARYIGGLLASLAAQTRPPDEVVVVDAGSVDGTAAAVSAAAAGFPVLRLVRAGSAFPGRARNIGVRDSSGDVIAMTDSDTVPDPDWLSSISAPFDSDPGLGGVFGTYYVSPETYTQRCIAAVIMSGGKDLDGMRGAHTDSFVSAALRKGALERAGWFREDVRAGEDMELRARLDPAGVKVAYCGAARVRWRTPETLWGMMRRTAAYIRERALAAPFSAVALKLPALYLALGAVFLFSPAAGLALALLGSAARTVRAAGRLSGEERGFLLSPLNMAALVPVYFLNDIAAIAGAASAVFGRGRSGL
ncbi:MAG: glycosyltransferase [Elusimicrobia bacterium]|nr:glycosyltransferase [Elusimicrobiota bacterium]